MFRKFCKDFFAELLLIEKEGSRKRPDALIPMYLYLKLRSMRKRIQTGM